PTRSSRRSKWTLLPSNVKASIGSGTGGAAVCMLAAIHSRRRSNPRMRANSEALEHILGMTPRREHQGRNELAALAQFAHHFETVLARQHDVQDQEIESAGSAQYFQR